jgi:hypothetical protein
MIEIIQIIAVFIIFSFLLILPINVTKKRDGILQNNYHLLAYNLIINCNILLTLSFLTIPLSLTIKLISSIYIILFFINYSKNLYKININSNIYIFFSIFFILSINIANEINLGWDAKYFYYNKALSFFEDNTFSNLKNINAYHFHPHFGSYLWAFFWKISFLKNEYFGRLFYLFIYCFSLLKIINYFNYDKKIKLIIYIILILLSFKYSLFSGLQEILIFSFLILSSIFLFEIYNNKNIFLNLIFLLLVCNIIFWIKIEAIFYVIFLMVLLNLNKINLQLRMLSLLTLFLLIIFKIIVYKYYDFIINGQHESYNLEYLKSIDLNIFITKITTITKFLIYYLIKNYLLIISLISLFILRNDKRIYFFKIFLLFNIIYLFSIYIFINKDAEYIVRTTMDRMLFAISGFYIFLILFFIKNSVIKRNQNISK